jgi:hypothetical protein
MKKMEDLEILGLHSRMTIIHDMEDITTLQPPNPPTKFKLIYFDAHFVSVSISL